MLSRTSQKTGYGLRYWEDIRPGQSFPLGCIRLNVSDIVGFASAYDPQVFHTDPERAKSTFLRGLAASGWQSCAIMMRCLHDRLFSTSAYIGMPRIDSIRWQAPLRPEQTVTVAARCMDKRPLSNMPAAGVCALRVEASNAEGRSVTRWDAHAIFARRARDADDADAPLTDWRALMAPGRKACTRRAGGPHMLKFFDDVQNGDEIAVGSYTFHADEIERFAERFDPVASWRLDSSPLVRAGGTGNTASIWHVAAAWMRSIVDYYNNEREWLHASGRPAPRLGPSPGIIHARWPNPVCAGDSIAFRSWAERKVELPDHSGWGLLLAGSEGINQRGETVVSFFPQLLLERRASHSATPDGWAYRS
jgi:acyl dehydratase